MIFRKVFVHPRYPQELSKLFELVYNLWWSCNYDAINLFYRIDASLFREVDHNPIELLYRLPRERIKALSEDKGFLNELEKVWQKFQEYQKTTDTFKVETDELSNKDVIAYFLMEFGVHESVPLYAGGLGIFSGDFLKSASDTNLPVIGIGLLYKYGYFTQRINLDGRQEEIFIEFENHFLSIREVRTKDGKPAFINVQILNENVKVKLWQIHVGKTRFILLDTDIDDNPPHLRDITNELYVAEREKRIQQELVLGLGGIWALDVLGVIPKVYHLNEGHSAFLIVARLKKLVTEGFSFSEARAVIRASTVFTTHTPVTAGNEKFKLGLVKKYLEPEVKSLGISFEQFASFGSEDHEKDIFSLPAFAIRFSRYVNGVSLQHRDVARRMWAGLFPERPEVEIPIGYVTNGVHMSWISEPFTYILNRYIGPDFYCSWNKEKTWRHVFDVPDDEFWEAHYRNKKILVPFVRKKVSDDLSARGYTSTKYMRLSSLLHPDYLTVVFAKRFAHYKRATLILKDKERLKRILTDPKKPVQLIFAGKAHPADETGKNMIKEIIDFAREYEVEDRVIFLENYDINIARHLVWGADVWLSTPMKDMEASGTSGMKAAMNGVLNLSTLEGWWKEGFNGKNGWAITAGEFYSHSDLQEVAEANQIYDLLEEEIVPAYYDRNEAGIPERWVGMMKESVYSVCQKFNMSRVLRDYTKNFYLPSLKESERLSREDYKLLKLAIAEESEVLKYWEKIEFLDFSTDIDKTNHPMEGDKVKAECKVKLGEVKEELFKVEVFYLYDENRKHKLIPMKLEDKKDGIGYYTCSFQIEGHGVQNINARIKPTNEIVEDLHPELIKWAD